MGIRVKSVSVVLLSNQSKLYKDDHELKYKNNTP